MPIWLHVTFVIIITVYSIFRYIKDRYFYELLFLIWAPTTLLTYVITGRTALLILGISQVVFFVLVVFFMFRKRGARLKQSYKLLSEFNAQESADEADETKTDESAGNIK